MNGFTTAPRCVLVLLGATGLGAALLALLLTDLAAVAAGALPAEAVLLVLAEATLAGCTLWAWLVTVVVCVEALRGSTAPARAVPPWARRAVLAACGAALVGSALPAATAADTGPAGGPQAPGGPGEMRTAARLVETPSPRRPPPRRYVVMPGDTLWDLAAGELGEQATDPAVAAYWQRIHRHNRTVIGTDPDLILPGQQLRVPLPDQHGEEVR